MRRLRRWSACGLVVVMMIVLRHVVLAQEAKEKEAKEKAAPAAAVVEKKAEEKKPEEKKAEPPKEEAKAPEPMPPNFGGNNEDPKNPGKYVDPISGEANTSGDASKDPKNAWPDATGANAGQWATPASDGKGDKPSDVNDPKTGPMFLYQRIVHNLFSVNIVWTLVTGFLVMFMQTGFMLVETGMCRAKNAAHTSAMNFMIYPLGCLAFWAYGFALGWGNWTHAPAGDSWYASLGPGTAVLDHGLGLSPILDKDTKQALPNQYKYGIIGTKGWFLADCDDVGVMALFFFMMVFMDTTATIPTGTMAERWAWKNFCLYGVWVALPYCIYANWLWGGGWLAQMGVNWNLGHGAVDFAGSGVVHGMGGIIGLAGGIVIGPRIGKYVNGKATAIPAHHVPMVVTGTFILAFGWFGFNPGSTLSGTDMRIAVITVNTMLASITGAIGAMLMLNAKGLKPDTTMMCNGMLAGLVAITAPCAFVDSWAAAAIGFIAGILVVVSVFFFEKCGVDDCVGAISVHGVNGIWGVISVGLFANGKYGVGWNGVNPRDAFKDFPSDGVRGLFFGDTSQLWAQLIDAAVLCVFGFVMAYVWFKISNLITPIRVSAETEMAGLDVPEMGIEGYPDFTVSKLSET